jgi:hypothetical protein
MNDAPLFSPRLLVGLGGLVIVIFAASLLLTGGAGSEGETWGANSWSRSAIGGRALYEMLSETGRKVSRTRVAPSALGDDQVLVLDQPSLTIALRARLQSAKRILLILPKWAGRPDPNHDGWIDDSWPTGTALAETALFPLDSTATVARVAPPLEFDVDTLGFTPTIVEPAQFARSSVLRPLVGSGDNILVGEISDSGRRILVLADPDPLENHGLAKPGNADFAVALFDRIGGGKTSFLFDETIHGFVGAGSEPGRASPALRMLRFPGDLIFLQAAVAVLLLIWASVGRFGPPLPTPRAFSSGKRALLANIAALIDFGGHHSGTLRRYIEAMVADGATQLHPPPGLAVARRAEWIDRAAAARGARQSASAILAAARGAADGDLAALLTAAQAAHRWRREIGHGVG